MVDDSNAKNVDIQDLHKDNSDSEREPHVLTQEQLDEQIKTYFAPVSSQL